MKRLLATTVFAFIASASMAQANDPETVKIRQKFDLPRYKVQDVTNYTGAVTDTTDSSLSGTNIQSLLQWCDVSTDGGVGDIYDFSRYTDEAQLVSNTAISSYGDVGAALESVTIFNYAKLEDMLGGAGHIGDHILVDQLVWGTEQKGINTILAKGEVLEGSSPRSPNSPMSPTSPVPRVAIEMVTSSASTSSRRIQSRSPTIGRKPAASAAST